MITPRRIILCLSLSFLLAFAFTSRVDAQDINKELWDRAESAYLNNDIGNLKESLAQLEVRLDKPQDDYHYEKLLGNLFYCETDIDSSYYGDALVHYSKALELCPLVDRKAVIELEIAQLLYKQKRYQEALPFLNKANYTLSEATVPYVLCLSQIASSCEEFDQALEILEDVMQTASEDELPNILRAKAKVLILKDEAGFTSDVELASKLLQDYFTKQKDYICHLFGQMTSEERENYWMRQRQFIVDTYRLEDRSPDFLYDVALFSKNLLLRFSSRNTQYDECTWDIIQNSLPVRGCAIEFIQYTKSKDTYLAALVIKKKGNPSFVRIGRVEDVLSIKLAEEPYTVETAIKGDDSFLKDALYGSAELKRTIWPKELQRLLNGVEDVYFSPDGFLHQLAIEYIYPKKRAPRFHRLTTTQALVNKRAGISALAKAPAMIVGDVDLVGESTDAPSNVNDPDAYGLLKSKHISFRNLNETEEKEIYSSRGNKFDTLITYKGAREDIFRYYAPQYDIVHVSTHGYFSGNLEVTYNEILPCVKDNTLSSSVILFSGASSNLRRDSFEANEYYDGILSARELSDMDMSHVALCVLAACQTALGYVTGDGVYGIQRGLKNAGAGAIVISLWSVNSYATRELMVNMYGSLQKGDTIREAFDKARKSVLKNSDLNTPYYSDAFILIDDI